MNAAYVEIIGNRRPARTAISVQDLPKPGALLTMNLTAVTKGAMIGYVTDGIGS
jgi:2-iminobutanoate/2-iminopropanoate deaminase